MPDIAQRIYRGLKQSFNVFYDDKGAVGRRYRRMDEAGTPYCLTIDGQTLQDQTVTIRDRDTLGPGRTRRHCGPFENGRLAQNQGHKITYARYFCRPFFFCL